MGEIAPSDAANEVTIPMLEQADPQKSDKIGSGDEPPTYDRIFSPVKESPIKESPFKTESQRPSFKKMVEDTKPSVDIPQPTTEVPLPALRQIVNEAISQKELRELIAQRTKERRAKLVEKFVGALTLHGYSHFHEATGPRKVLWAMILLASAGFFIGLTYLSYYSDSYYSQNVDRTSETSSEVDFPTITMCNFNPVYAQDMHKDLPFTITHREFLIFYYAMMSNRGNIYGIKNDTVIKKVRDLFRKNGVESYSEMLNYFEINKGKHIHPDVITEIIGEGCQFEGQPCSLDDDFRTVFRNAGQSVCKQFNYYKGQSDKGIASKKTGMNGGLSMYWSIEGKQYHYSSKHGNCYSSY